MRAMASAPNVPNAANQMRMMGPNMPPTRSVPRLCIRNRPTRMPSVTGSTSAPKAGSSSSRPSTALNTEIAGVSMPSPKNSASPRTAAKVMMPFVVRDRPDARCANAASASTPPSPLLSARRMKTTYLIVTTTISDQKISDSDPNTASALGWLPPIASADRRRAYRGLVPMSPYTTPSAAKVSTARRFSEKEELAAPARAAPPVVDVMEVKPCAIRERFAAGDWPRRAPRNCREGR